MHLIPKDEELERLLELTHNRTITLEEIEEQRKSWVRGEMGMGTDADEAAYILKGGVS